MAAVVCIESESSAWSNTLVQSVTRNYNIKNASNRVDAETALLVHADCPVIDPDYSILRRKPVAVTEIKNPKHWSATVTWERWVPKDVGTEKLSGTISVQSAKVDVTKSHIGSYAGSGQTAINAQGLINHTKDDVDGVEIPFPVLSFSIRKTYAKGTATLAFLAGLHGYAGKANSSTWRGFGIGEVRFDGATTSDDDPDFDDVTYTFSASPTITGLVVPSPWGSSITIPTKLGWDYLWFSKLPYQDATTGRTIHAPHTAHVDRVHDFANLNLIL